MAKVRAEYETELRPIAVSLVTPACRMVVIELWESCNVGEEPTPDFYPVVAVRASIERCYKKRYLPGEPEPSTLLTEKQLIEDRWCFFNQRIDQEVLYLSDDTGWLITPRHYAPEDEMIVRVVTCPWPQEEDEQRLAGIVRQMQIDLKAKLEQLDAATPKDG
jgi:hypothetical protein